MALTDEERERIREEEAERSKARKEAERAARTAWDHFNSPLVLWALSTVLVGLGTWGYTTWRDAVRDRQAKKREAERLNDELIHRLSLLRSAVERLQEELETKRDRNESPAGMYHRLLSAYTQAMDPAVPFYSDYKGVTLQTLLDRLKAAVEASERGRADRIDACLRELRQLDEWIRESYDRYSKPRSPKDFARGYVVVGGALSRTLGCLVEGHLSDWALARARE